MCTFALNHDVGGKSKLNIFAKGLQTKLFCCCLLVIDEVKCTISTAGTGLMARWGCVFKSVPFTGFVFGFT